MKTITELLKERMLIRATDPDRSNVILMVVDGAKKLAKEEGREAEPKDILASVKSQIKQTEKAIAQVKEKGGDAGQAEKELAILKTFLPAGLSEDQTKAEIEKILAALPEADRIKKNQGKIMGQLKAIENLDMGVASKLLANMLK